MKRLLRRDARASSMQDGIVLKKVVLGVLAAIVVAVVVVGGFVFSKVSAFDDSMAKLYSVPMPAVTASTDAAVIARGEHLAHSLGSCFNCHGEKLEGGHPKDMGPLGSFKTANLTTGKNGVLS